MIKTIFIICLLVIFTGTNGFCFSENDLSDLEYSTYGQNFDDESLASRLNRLETDFFGTQQGGNLDSRLNQLGLFSTNQIQTPSFNGNYYPGIKESGIKRFFNNLGSSFDNYGTLTGYTPPIINHYPNSNIWGNYNNFDYNNYNKAFCPYHNKFNANRNWYRPSRIMHRPHNIPNQAFYNPYRRNNIHPGYYNTNVLTGSSVNILKD